MNEEKFHKEADAYLNELTKGKVRIEDILKMASEDSVWMKTLTIDVIKQLAGRSYEVSEEAQKAGAAPPTIDQQALSMTQYIMAFLQSVISAWNRASSEALAHTTLENYKNLKKKGDSLGK